MARAGILYSHVAQAAARLVADDKNPTVDNVREALGGTGSKSTIAPLLKRWKAEHQDVIAKSELGLPADLLQAVKGVYDKLQADVQQQLEQAREEHRTVLQGAADQVAQGEAASCLLTTTNIALSAELKQTKDALARLQAEHQSQSVTLASLQSDNAGLQQRLADRAAEVFALNQQLTQARAQFEHYQDAMAAQRSEERQATDQRIARLEQELAGTQSQMLAQQSTIGQQEARLVQLTADNQRLQESTCQAEQALNDVKAGRDQFAYQVQELMASREEMSGKIDVLQQQLTDACMRSAAREKEVQMLTENLNREIDKAAELDRERQALLQTNSQLMAEAAFQNKERKNSPQGAAT